MPGKKEAVIDFLMYLTSKDVYAKFIETSNQVPVIKDVEPKELLKPFTKDGYHASYFYKIGSGNGLKFDDIARKIIEGQDVEITDETFAEFQKSIDAWVQSNLDNRPEITAETNWGADHSYQYIEYTGYEFKD